jgi:hypothetical protein
MEQHQAVKSDLIPKQNPMNFIIRFVLIIVTLPLISSFQHWLLQQVKDTNNVEQEINKIFDDFKNDFKTYEELDTEITQQSLQKS